MDPADGLADAARASTAARPSRSIDLSRDRDRRARLQRQWIPCVSNVAEPLRIAMARSLDACQGRESAMGGSITGGTKPYKIFWSPAGGLSNRAIPNPVLTPVGSLLYTVTITDAQGCQLVDSVRVTMLPAPALAIAAEGPTELCAGQQVRLRATPGLASYVWSNGEKTPDILVREAGEFRATVTDSRGCVATSEPVRVRVHELPEPRIAALGPLTFCEGDSVVLDAGKGYAAYRWSTGATGRYLGVRQAGTYSVTVRGEGGCEAEATPVTAYTRPVPLAQLALRRDTLLAGEAPKYEWLRDGKSLRGATGRMLVADRSGRYQVRVSNETGCESLSEIRDLRFGSATVSLPRVDARTGDTVEIALRLVKPTGLDAAGAGAMTALVAVKKKTLDLISGAEIVSESENEILLRVPGRYQRGSDAACRVSREGASPKGGASP
jgi:hypothetical protein